MYIEVRDVTCGTTPFKYRFSPKDDMNGKDGAGYWYAESGWTQIHSGHTYQIYYEAFTAPGYNGTGHNRKGTCTLWIEYSIKAIGSKINLTKKENKIRKRICSLFFEVFQKQF